MKVLKFSLFVLQFCVTFAITVPPTWHKNHDSRNSPSRRPQISYKYPSVSTTLVPISSDKFEYFSFFPSDAKPAKSVQQLQYRPPNSQHLVINHPSNNQERRTVKNHTPQSYQIFDIDNQNQDVPVTQQKRKSNLNQHLVGVTSNQFQTNRPQHRTNNRKQHSFEAASNQFGTNRPKQHSHAARNQYGTDNPQQHLIASNNYHGNNPKQYSILVETNRPRQQLSEAGYRFETNGPKPQSSEIVSNSFEQNNPTQQLFEVPNNQFEVKRHNQHLPEAASNSYQQNIPKQHLITSNPQQRQRQRTRQNTQNREPIRQHLTEVRPSNSENLQDKEENESEELNEPISEHEIPREVPTRPIYPGEGKWAKFGIKHRPYIHEELQKPPEESEERPEGYDTFEKGEQLFERAKNNHHHDINTFPERHGLPSSKISDNSQTDPLYEKPEIGFVPEKLYTQVRRTETEEHLPRSSIDPEEEENAARLREVVKDKRIHTVYTEEGYEDSAYDHAGEEKNAENHEGHGKSHNDHSASLGTSRGGEQGEHHDQKGNRRGVNYERRKVQDSDRSKDEDYSNSRRYRMRKMKINQDSDTANSDQEAKKINTTVPTKDIKKFTLHNGKANIDMEIHTEVKYTPQKKKHKFVKIFPSPQVNTTEENKPVTRVKRYDRDELSKRYIRRRPQYYWKKKTTTEGPLTRSRQKFEAAFKFHSKKEDKFDPEAIQLTTQKNREDRTSTIKTATTTKGTSTTTTNKTPETTTGTTTTTTTTPSNTDEIQLDDSSTTTIHPDLMNPELTTKASKPATPKPPPVKIRKFKVKRQKRYTNDFPNLNVDLSEFTDVRKFPNPTKQPDLTFIKYPYYNLPISDNINEHSPLRYAEDMKNIPRKIENQLSFYESRESIKCPEIERNVNPIPERIGNQENGEETDKMAEKPDLPRLKGLGNKIDCLKVKYFGENPLDSPFFNEEVVQEPVPFFIVNKPTDNIDSRIDDQIGKSSRQLFLTINKPIDDQMGKNSQKHELRVKVLKPIVVLEEDVAESATLNPIHQSTEAVLKPPYTLTELMKMNQEKSLRTAPKSIYDQIHLLEREEEEPKNGQIVPQIEKFIILYGNEDVVGNASVTPKEEIEYTTSTRPQIRTRPTNSVKRLSTKSIRIPQWQFFASRGRTTTESVSTQATTTTTEATTTPTTTVPTTQSTTLPTTQSTTTQKPRLEVRVRQRQSENRPNNWQSMNRGITALYNIFDISRYLPHVPTTSNIQYRKLKKLREPVNVLQDVSNQANKDALDSKAVAVTIAAPKDSAQTEETLPKIRIRSESSTEKKIDLVSSSTSDPQKTTVNPEVTSASQRFNIFTFFSNLRRRLKRDINQFHNKKDDLSVEESEDKPVYTTISRNKPQYTEIVRQRPARIETQEEEEEDLNPRKRFYEISLNKQRSTTPTPIYEEDIVEEIVAMPPTTTLEPKIYPVEASKNDPNIPEFISFIGKLHEKWAKEDATSTTEATTVINEDKGDNAALTTQQVSESVNVRRGEPTYLQIINQLHVVHQEQDAKTPTTTTTVAYQTIPVRNSNPFIAEHDSFLSEVNSMKANLNVDDSTADSTNTNSESSKNRNFSARFKTNIDTSKYKTIERAPVTVRHNLSSRYNADDQVLPLEKDKTTQTPTIIAHITRPQATTEIPKETTSEPNPTPLKESDVKELTTVRSIRQRSRSRGRSSFTVSTIRPSTSTTANPLFRRRRPTRITTTTTTTTSKPEIYRRRNVSRQKAIEAQSLSSTTNQTPKEESSDESEEPKKQRRFQKVQERRVTSEVTFTKFFEPASDELASSEESKKNEYEVIAPLTNLDTHHGGNYRREHEQSPEESSGQIHTPDNFYSDPTLALNINQLKETKEVTTQKTQASNVLLNKEEIEEKVAQKPASKINLYPNMARMVNRLAEVDLGGTSVADEDNFEEETTLKPLFITDPSKRLYYYAKL